MNKQAIIGSAVVAVLAIGGGSAYAIDQHNKEVAAKKAKVIKDQSAKLTTGVKTFNTKDLTKADQTITDIKVLKFVKTVDEKRDAKVKTLTADLYKAASAQVAQVKAAKYDYNKTDAAGKAFDNLTKTIKGLKSLSADQIKTLTTQLAKDKKTVVDNLNKQKATAAAEKKAAEEAAAQAQAQQEAATQEQAAATDGTQVPQYSAPATGTTDGGSYTAPSYTAPSTTAPAQGSTPSAPASGGNSSQGSGNIVGYSNETGEAGAVYNSNTGDFSF